MTPGASREPRSLPPGRAFAWFGDAIRLWKRGPLVFSAMAVVIIAAIVGLSVLPVVGKVVANVVVALLACGLLFASLAADRAEAPRFKHLFMPFLSPLPAQLSVVVAAFVELSIEAAVAWSVAGVNLFAAGSDMSELTASTQLVIFATDVLVSLPFTFVPMAALFDGERMGAAFGSSLRAFARNPQTMLALGAYMLVLGIAGMATSGIGLVLAFPWIAAAQYVAWKDIYAVDSSNGRPPGEVA